MCGVIIREEEKKKKQYNLREEDFPYFHDIRSFFFYI
jgi:hypothetical protein